MLPLLWLLVARRKNPLLRRLLPPLQHLHPLRLLPLKHLQQLRLQPLPLTQLLLQQRLPLQLLLHRLLPQQPPPPHRLPTLPRSNQASAKKPPSGGFFVSERTRGLAWVRESLQVFGQYLDDALHVCGFQLC